MSEWFNTFKCAHFSIETWCGWNLFFSGRAVFYLRAVNCDILSRTSWENGPRANW